MSDHSCAIALRSLQSVSRGWPDAYGIILPGDTRVILSFDQKDANRRGLTQVGHVWSQSAQQAEELCVALCGCCGDIRKIVWLDDRKVFELYPLAFNLMEASDGSCGQTSGHIYEPERTHSEGPL